MMVMTSVAERAARLLCPFGSRRRVLRGPARGMRFVVEPGIGLTYVVAARGAAPPFWRELVRPGMTVVDVGANKGQMALIFAQLVGPTGHVVAIEPAPRECGSLARNVQLNRLAHVTVLQVAAGEAHEDLAFAYATDRPTQGKLMSVEESYRVATAEIISVRTAPLDDLVAGLAAIDLIKIDTEGAAAVVLKGAKRTLDQQSPTVYLELHGPDERAAVRDHLLARGYWAHTLDGAVVSDPVDGVHTPLICTPSHRRLPRLSM
jgi:FkbM family methyltransferase